MGSYDTRNELSAVDVIDIQSDAEKISLSKDTQNSLKSEPPSFSSLLLWDEQGLKRFEAITYVPEYYPTNCEIELLEKHSHDIAQRIEPNSIIVELGSGCLRKIKILLEALEAIGKPVDYYALDLSRSELERTLQSVSPGSFKNVKWHGLLGTYDDGLRWLQRPENASSPRVVLSLGSTLGSFTRPEAAEFLAGFVDVLNHGTSASEPLVIIGLDGCKDGEKVWHAYNDSENRNEEFIRNVLDHANRILRKDVFRQEEWERRGEWNDKRGRHEQYLVPHKDVWFQGRCLKAGEKIFVVSSHKYDTTERKQLWEGAGLSELKGWQTPEQHYGECFRFCTFCNGN
ncbi:Ergothioneine biosynthesis protein 1 [Exophiala dermatitidis]|uniref:4-dimethylallyltryptophan N-methyltransferase n=1 Tax=Exophiala dermatitidis (strain ATCC 34100 / CBS 525.76 / NIH/UT8656) TaxID=858893 RepID=H6C670_EXODN|nr:uncharacterized protein HMPREF1120_07211 [Exophiala dermatitidis NIH/UT8656]EHY59216.1 hypothetical protein HMPREF1120_07211 [Exophiala dermatitidis NIH/UT8656]